MGKDLYVRLQIDGKLYEFCRIERGSSDPSIYFHFRLGSGKKRKLSYHPTGAVRHHDLVVKQLQFFEPLSAISQVNGFLYVMLDQAELREVAQPDKDGGAVLPIQSSASVVGLAIAPSRADDLSSYARLEIPQIGFSVYVMDLGEPVMDLRPEGTFAFAPATGLFAEQAMTEEAAELAYVQMLAGTKEAIITVPNGEGFRTFYPAVQMSRIPDVTIKSSRPDVKLEVRDNAERHKIPFRVTTKSGRVKSDSLEGIVDEVFFNARLQ